MANERRFSAASLERAYRDVESDALDSTALRERPEVIVLGGQPGAGKSTLAADAIRGMRGQGGVVVIDADRMREGNPYYRQLSREDPQNAADRTHAQASTWAERLTASAIAERRNLVIDGTMRNPEKIQALAGIALAAGYRVEARVLAVPAATSILRARLRFERQFAVSGTGRFVNQAQHDVAYIGVADSVRMLENQKLAHTIRLYDVHQRLIYENKQERGAWIGPAQAAEQFDAAREQAWSHAEHRDHVAVLEQITTLIRQREGTRSNLPATGLSQAPSDRGEWDAKLVDARARIAGIEKVLGQSRDFIYREALQKGLIVRDATTVKRDLHGEIVAISSHHALLKISELVAIRYQRDNLATQVHVGERIGIQYGKEQSQVHRSTIEKFRADLPHALTRAVARDHGR